MSPDSSVATFYFSLSLLLLVNLKYTHLCNVPKIFGIFLPRSSTSATTTTTTKKLAPHYSHISTTTMITTPLPPATTTTTDPPPSTTTTTIVNAAGGIETCVLFEVEDNETLSCVGDEFLCTR